MNLFQLVKHFNFQVNRIYNILSKYNNMNEIHNGEEKK